MKAQEILRTSDVLVQRLERIYEWYEGMVNRRTGLLEYLYDPPTNTFLRQSSPLRDFGAGRGHPAATTSRRLLPDLLPRSAGRRGRTLCGRGDARPARGASTAL